MDSTNIATIITLLTMGLLVGIGIPLGAIGIQLLTMPNSAITISSYTVALMFISFAFFAAIIVYTKTRLTIGLTKIEEK